jgi:hypothetical protein
MRRYECFQATEKLDPSLVRTEGCALTVRFIVTITNSYTDDPKELMGAVTPLTVA